MDKGAIDGDTERAEIDTVCRESQAAAANETQEKEDDLAATAARLKQTGAEEEDFVRHRGREAGEVWARHSAERSELRWVAEGDWEPNGSGAAALQWFEGEVPSSMITSIAFDDLERASVIDEYACDYVEAFAEGARSVWLKVKANAY